MKDRAGQLEEDLRLAGTDGGQLRIRVSELEEALRLTENAQAAELA